MKGVDLKGETYNLEDLEKYITNVFYHRNKPQANRFNWDGMTVEVFEGLMGKEGDQYKGFSARVGTLMTGKGGLKLWIKDGIVNKDSKIIYNSRILTNIGKERFFKWLMKDEA